MGLKLGLQRPGITVVSSLGSWTFSMVTSWRIQVLRAPGMPEVDWTAMGDRICGSGIDWGSSGRPLAEAEWYSELCHSW